MKTKKRLIGDLGEGVVCNFLLKNNYRIIDRNYWKPWGEIDIIAEKTGVLHFVEVKSVSRENLSSDVNRETKDEYVPEDNLHPWKLKRLSRVIQTYLLEKGISEDDDWQFDVFIAYLDIKNRLARVKCLENIIIS